MERNDNESANPVLVEVTRGAAVESRHRGAAAVVDAAGTVRAAWGDIAASIYPRSAIKPLQALSWIETGAADAQALDDRAVALACASHSGEPVHTERVAAWLGDLGLSAFDLECGPHAPIDTDSAAALVRAGRAPERLHNNCSGKHAGFLTGAVHAGEPTHGYTAPDHPAQIRMVRVLEEMGEADLGAAPRGVDGCGIPVVAMPLQAMARAFAKLADGDALAGARRDAAARIAGAMIAEPYFVAGRGRFDTCVIEAARGGVLVKGGAEGVYAGVDLQRKLGIALKIDDGAKRAAEAAMGALLIKLGAVEGTIADWRDLFEPAVLNTNGRAVGVVRAAAALCYDSLGV